MLKTRIGEYWVPVGVAVSTVILYGLLYWWSHNWKLSFLSLLVSLAYYIWSDIQIRRRLRIERQTREEETATQKVLGLREEVRVFHRSRFTPAYNNLLRLMRSVLSAPQAKPHYGEWYDFVEPLTSELVKRASVAYGHFNSYSPSPDVSTTQQSTYTRCR